MKTHLTHLQVNVSEENLPFYKDLFGFLGWQPIWEGEGMFGTGAGDASLWFAGGAKDAAYDYDGPGVNHISIGAASQADVDATATYLTEKGVSHLFETPRHRPEFSSDEGQTYYQVMFESPDRVLFEVVYTGPKSD